MNISEIIPNGSEILTDFLEQYKDRVQLMQHLFSRTFKLEYDVSSLTEKLRAHYTSNTIPRTERTAVMLVDKTPRVTIVAKNVLPAEFEALQTCVRATLASVGILPVCEDAEAAGVRVVPFAGVSPAVVLEVTQAPDWVIRRLHENVNDYLEVVRDAQTPKQGFSGILRTALGLFSRVSNVDLTRVAETFDLEAGLAMAREIGLLPHPTTK